MTVLLRIHDTKTDGEKYKLFNDRLVKTKNKKAVYSSYLKQLHETRPDVVLEFIYPNHKEYITVIQND